MKLNKLQRLISSKRTLSRIEGRICTTIPDEGFDFKACKSLWSAVHPTNQILHEIHLMAKHQNSIKHMHHTKKLRTLSRIGGRILEYAQPYQMIDLILRHASPYGHISKFRSLILFFLSIF